jgi:hypothetical protein
MVEDRPMSEAEAVWGALNPRQQHYLAIVYRHDQEAERAVRGELTDWSPRPSADEWRWLTFSVKAPTDLVGRTSIQQQLRMAGEHDPGAGSSLAALRRRALIEVQEDSVQVLGSWAPRVRVRLTRLGRAAARAGLHETPARRPPPGLMTRRLWAALIRVYAAGEAGLGRDDGGRHSYGGMSWNLLLQLRDRARGSFIQEGNGSVWVSDRGRRHHELHWACYRELYPDLEAPRPPAVADAHQGLGDHRRPRPPRLLLESDWRVLFELFRLERSGSCPWRQQVMDEYDAHGIAPPPALIEAPNGLTLWEARDMARARMAVRRLLDYTDGPLVELVDVDHVRLRPQGEPIDVVCLSPLGREHVQRHLADYRQLYPEMDWPQLPTPGDGERRR